MAQIRTGTGKNCRRNVAWLKGVLTAFIVFVVAAPAAAASWATRLQSAQISVANAERAVADWSFQSKAAVAILIVTVLAGALTVIVQAVEKPWKRIATVIFGAIVTGVTLLGSGTLDGDFKTMNARAKQGRQFVETARYWLDQVPKATSDDDRNVDLEELSKALTSFSQVSTVKTTISLWPLGSGGAGAGRLWLPEKLCS